MYITELLLISLSLSMDAFSVSVTTGIRSCKNKNVEALKIGFFFGLFQGLMPVLGFFLAHMLSNKIKAYGHWVAFILLGIIGGKMLYDAFFTPDTCVNDSKEVDIKSLFILSIATSIDALAVGISFAALYPDINILPSAMIIATVTFLLSSFGVVIGKKIGCFLQKKAEALGGLILVCIGIKILIEHFMSK